MVELGEFSDLETSSEAPPPEKSLNEVVKSICERARDQIHRFEGKEPIPTVRRAVNRLWMVLTKDGYWVYLKRLLLLFQRSIERGAIVHV